MLVKRISNLRKQQILSTMFVLLITLLAGCGSKSERTLGTGQTLSKSQMSKEDLREQLNGFTVYFRTALDAAVNEIEQKSSSKRDQMTSMQMRSKMLQGLYAMSQQDDALIAFIDVWALCVRFRIFLEEGDGSKLYGINQPVAVDTAKRIESHIMDIGRLFLSENTFQATEKSVNDFARKNSIRVNFSNVVIYATETKEGGKTPFEAIVSIPMAPFRGMEGVERTAAAVGRFTDTADRFSDIIADLPESSRIQLLLFLYELEETELAKTLTSSTAKLSDSSVRLADSSEKFPLLMREQLSLLLDEIDTKQANLQLTLVQADQTAESIRIALEKVKEGADSIGAAAKTVTETADAWRDAASATGDAVKEIVKLKPAEGADPSAAGGQNIQEMAGKIAEAASEIRAAVEDLKQLSGALVWHIVEVIAAILAAVIIYRLAMMKISKATGSKKDD